MSQQAARHPHRTSAAPGHRRRRSPRLLLVAALLSLPLSACAGQLTSAPDQATQEVTVKATALTDEQVTSLEGDATTGPDVDFATLPTHNSTITVLINWQKKYRKPLGTTLVSRNRSDGALKWAVAITPPGASRNALEVTEAPQQNVSDLLKSRTSGEIVVSPDGLRVSLILTPHRGQLEERLAEQGLTRQVVNVSTGSSVDVTGTIVDDRGVPTGPGLVVGRTSTDASGETTFTPVFWFSSDDDGHPPTPRTSSSSPASSGTGDSTMTDEHSDQSQDTESPAPAGSAEAAEATEAAEAEESTEAADSVGASDGSVPAPPRRVLTMLRALRALRLGWLLAVGAMAVLFLVYQSGLRDPGHTMKAVGGFVGGLAALIWITGYFKWRETARFALKSHPSSPRALVKKTVLFQPLCLLMFSGGFAIVILRLWHVQLRSTSVSINQLLTLAVGVLGLGLLAATDLLVRATRATYFPPPKKRRFPERLHRLRRIRLPRPSWRSVLGAVVLIVIPPLALGAAATVPHLVWGRVTPSTAASIDTSALPALPRSFASTAAWSQDVHGMMDVVAGAAGPVVLSSDGVVGLNPADGSTRWTYQRKHARFIRCHPSPDRHHLAVTLDSTDGEEPKGMSVEPLVVVLDTVTGRVTYEGFMQGDVLQITDSVLLNGTTGYSLTDGSRLWSIDAEDVSVSPDTWPYSGTAGHSSFLLRGTQRRPDGRESRDGLYGTYTLMPDTAPSVRRESAPLLTDGRGSPLVVGGWVAAFTQTPTPIDFQTSPTGWAAQAVNLDAMAGVAGADTTTYDLGLTSGANITASHATGTLTTLPQRTVGNGAGSMPTSPQELEGGTAVAAIFDPQTRTVSHSAQEAGVLSYAGLARAESGSGGVLSVSSGERTPTTVDVPAGSTYYPPGTRHVWTIDDLSPSSNPLLTTLSTPGTTLVIMATGPDKGSHSFRIFGISGASS